MLVNPPQEYEEAFPQGQASLGSLNPWVKYVWDAIRRDPMGGMGVVVGSGATPAIQAAVKQRFMSRLHPNMAKFLERRPETIKIQELGEAAKLPPPGGGQGWNVLADTTSRQAVQSQLTPQIEAALQRGMRPENIAEAIRMKILEELRQPIGAMQRPKTDILIRWNPNRAGFPTTPQHEATHAALYLTKPELLGLTAEHTALAQKAIAGVPPVNMQPALSEQIIEFMAQNALRRAGMLR